MCIRVNSCTPGKSFMFFIVVCCFFSKLTFSKKKNQKFLIPSECQTDWVQIRPYVSSGRIWVQIVYKGYQQMTLQDKELLFTHLKTEHRKFYCKTSFVPTKSDSDVIFCLQLLIK